MRENVFVGLPGDQCWPTCDGKSLEKNMTRYCTLLKESLQIQRSVATVSGTWILKTKPG